MMRTWKSQERGKVIIRKSGGQDCENTSLAGVETSIGKQRRRLKGVRRLKKNEIYTWRVWVVERWLPKGVQALIPKTMNVAFHGKRDFYRCDQVKELEMGTLSWIIQVEPKGNHKSLYKSEAGVSVSEKDLSQGKPRSEREISRCCAMTLRLEDGRGTISQGTCMTCRSRRRPRNRFSTRVSTRNAALPTPGFQIF